MRAFKRRLVKKKKKRTYSKPLFNKLHAETDCKAIFFSPLKIKQAIELQEERKQL
jgi:hypothetical protein